DKSFLAKVFSVQMVPGFFDNITYSVAGEDLTLNDIENQKLREDFEDPRIHFAIVCASRSCPKIQNKVFTPKRLDKRLDAAARIFLQDEYRNRLNKEKNTLYLSQIFDWFDGDFIKESGSVVDYVKQYLPKKDTRYISKNSIKVKHLFYNWILNIK
ncbi:MAG: DUF547 domain-containing protein, partial [Candidatus Omnitrophota bacterium]|nr:DUF547 domain-containing protein [Candidatus Omnitrophota bacterium]